VGRVFTDSVLAWYRRRMKDEGFSQGRSGAVTVVQRTSSDMKLNPHFHAVFLMALARDSQTRRRGAGA
jgi:hypothetical protein